MNARVERPAAASAGTSQDPATWQRRALAWGRKGRLHEAAGCCRRALALRPNFPEAHFCLGRVHAQQGKWETAVRCFEQALRLRSRYPAVLHRLGMALSALHRWDEAISCFRKLAHLQPHRASAHRCCGEACASAGRFREALQHVERSLRLSPDNPEARVHRAMLWLRRGDFGRGWVEYEWRWRLQGHAPRARTSPAWDGSPLRGRTILLHAEQGLGDTLHFVRYASLLQASGARVILEAPPGLIPLLTHGHGIDDLVAAGDVLPDHDVHAALLSLPRLLRTTRRSIPARVPYLAAEAANVARWRRRLARYRGFKVGIAWQGNPLHPEDRQRSIPLLHFARLARIPGVRLFSLQKRSGRQPRVGRPPRFPLVDLGRSADRAGSAFVDTAAILQNLDLVITCDTSVAHLAGGLGAPVWLAVSTNADWRWLQGSTDSPWYPSMTLFRQRTPGDWPEVFERLAQALEQQISSPRMTPPITVSISPGELLDKLSILKIKLRLIREPKKRRNIRVELAGLQAARIGVPKTRKLARMERSLREVNEALWRVEDAIRQCEAKRDFGPRFIRLARSVYRQNDRRARLKREINRLLGSPLIEEKSHATECRM